MLQRQIAWVAFCNKIIYLLSRSMLMLCNLNSCLVSLLSSGDDKILRKNLWVVFSIGIFYRNFEFPALFWSFPNTSKSEFSQLDLSVNFSEIYGKLGVFRLSPIKKNPFLLVVVFTWIFETFLKLYSRRI